MKKKNKCSNVGSTRPRLCLAGSGGGHIRQILDLETLWREYKSFIITEKTALGETLAQTYEVEFVDHFAVGQARLGAPFSMLSSALKNMVRSFQIIMKHRPDVLISTGAGAAFFAVLFARLTGAYVIVIDSMARVHSPSLFARIVGPLAHIKVSQGEIAAKKWGDAISFDSLRILGSHRPAKEPFLFVTVGATLKFDRLITMVDVAKRKGLITEHVLAQNGCGGRTSDQFETVETMSFDKVKSVLDIADIVVCHGGTGSLITALQAGCRVIAVPRSFARGEHYDDHQQEITEALAARGLIIPVETQEEFEQALIDCRGRQPVSATRDLTEMIGFLRQRLDEWPRLAKSRRENDSDRS